MSAHNRLATYGTLAPGQINHHELSGLNGKWTKGFVKGRLVEEGWGAEHGCPGIILDPEGEEVVVSIFESFDLLNHWERLDAFEGAEYRRTVTTARTDEGEIEISIYEIKK